MTSRIAIVATLALAIAPYAHAQGRGRARGQVTTLRFQEMDKNYDGVVARAEWTGTPASFRTHDWNRDGVLSGDELRVDRRGRPLRDESDFDSAYRDYSYDDWTLPGFQSLDHNHDNRLSSDEWHFDRELFVRADHNRDGVISRAEFLAEDSLDDDREDSFANLDANRDGRVTRTEWHGGTLLFNALDDDHDGVISRAELVGSEPPANLFTSVDVNGDGSISVAEWHWSRPSFDRRDVNKDGRLTQEEFRGVVAPNSRSASYRAGYERGLVEGRSAGREDRVRNQGWDLEGQRELESADSGYDVRIGPKAEYQAGYREAFRQAYREGWNNPTQ